MKQPAHSLLGASGAYRWLNCPGSFQLSLTAPARPSSIYAATGTVAHTLIERMLNACIKNGLRPGTVLLPPATPGETVQCEGHEVTVDQTFADGVNIMLDYVRVTARQSDWVNVEFQVELDSYFPVTDPPPVPLFGRVDVALLDLLTETLEIVDYKNGAGVRVNPRENPQLMYYAAGVLAQLLPNQQRTLRTVKLTVVQPNAPGTEPIRSWEIDAIDLLMWVDDVLVPGVHACKQDDAPLVPGSWCRFCPALPVCPRLRQDAVAMAKRDFDDALMPDDPAELAYNLDVAERAVLWATALQAHALDQLKHQVRIPGWEMVPTRPTRRWKLDEPSVAGALDQRGLSDDVIFETRLRSPAQIEKLARRVALDDLIESVSSGVKLNRVKSDPREDFANADGE